MRKLILFALSLYTCSIYSSEYTFANNDEFNAQTPIEVQRQFDRFNSPVFVHPAKKLAQACAGFTMTWLSIKQMHRYYHYRKVKNRLARLRQLAQQIKGFNENVRLQDLQAIYAQLSNDEIFGEQALKYSDIIFNPWLFFMPGEPCMPVGQLEIEEFKLELDCLIKNIDQLKLTLPLELSKISKAAHKAARVLEWRFEGLKKVFYTNSFFMLAALIGQGLALRYIYQIYPDTPWELAD